MAVDPLLSLLRASLEEQVPVALHLRGSVVTGIVVDLDETTVLVRHGHAYGAVRFAAIDAVIMQPHAEPASRLAGNDEPPTRTHIFGEGARGGQPGAREVSGTHRDEH